MTDAREDREVSVELLGLARVLTRCAAVSVVVPNDATLQDVTRALVERYPTLVGSVLRPDGTLVHGSVFSLDGRAVTADLGQRLQSEEVMPPLILMTSMEGGR